MGKRKQVSESKNKPPLCRGGGQRGGKKSVRCPALKKVDAPTCATSSSRIGYRKPRRSIKKTHGNTSYMKALRTVKAPSLLAHMKSSFPNIGRRGAVVALGTYT